MNDRLKAARKAKNLTQREFGRRLGVKDTAISKLENGENAITDQMVLSVCREFGINEEWLRTGKGEMLVENDSNILASLASEYDLDSLDQKILETYMKLPEARRAGVKDFIVSLARAIENGEAEGVEQYIAEHPAPAFTLPRSAAVPYADNIEASRELTEEEAVALVRARFDAAKKGDASSSTLEKQA